MKINGVKMLNFGSYRGENYVPLSGDGGSITLVGGRNGAGKTTLFDAIRIALYGSEAFGYGKMAKAYVDQITRMVTVDRGERSKEAFVSIDFFLEGPCELERYTMTRSWSLVKGFEERLECVKDCRLLNGEEADEVQELVMNLVPPALLDVFFFDGEKVAERLLQKGHGDEMRRSMLSVTRLGTLDVMRHLFLKRAKAEGGGGSAVSYLEAKKAREEREALIEKTRLELEEAKGALVSLEAEKKSCEAAYRRKGGVTKQEWADMEAERRNELEAGWALKKELDAWVSEKAPLVLLKPYLEAVRSAALDEGDAVLGEREAELLCGALSLRLSSALGSDGRVKGLVEEAVQDLARGGKDGLLKLSFEEKEDLLALCDEGLAENGTEAARLEDGIDASLGRLDMIRKKMSGKSAENYDSFAEEMATLERKIFDAANNKATLEEALRRQEGGLEALKEDEKEKRAALAKELKSGAEAGLSRRGAVLMEHLMDRMSKSIRGQLERDFLDEMRAIGHKECLVSRIEVDAGFNVHAYRKDIEGAEHETDPSLFSKGEKQIFLLCLYWALSRASKASVPFMIDTPFARVDAEHRERIAREFLARLPCQAIIFSTDEELVGEPYNAIKDKVGKHLMLEASADGFTEVHSDKYFKEA